MAILILSTSNDITTNRVVKWLQYLIIPFVRYNLDEENDLDNIDIDQFSAYWFRKGNLLHSANKTPSFTSDVDEYINENNKKILEYFEFKLQKKKYINLFFHCTVNKLIVLQLAKEEGLLVPESKLIKNNKKISDKLIYKSINEGSSIYNRYNNSMLYTFTQNYDKSSKFAEFSQTLFQEKIEKKYELRIFYLDGVFYSMAIFSQQNCNTSLDYRNYDFEKPNRTVPYNLPKNIEIKLSNLMKKLKLKSGSIDLIVNNNNEYYFLEINPVGQFGMVSSPCNYNIEKAIVNYLIDE